MTTVQEPLVMIQANSVECYPLIKMGYVILFNKWISFVRTSIGDAVECPFVLRMQ